MKLQLALIVAYFLVGCATLTPFANADSELQHTARHAGKQQVMQPVIGSDAEWLAPGT